MKFLSYKELKKLLNENEMFWNYCGWYVDDKDVIISLKSDSDVGYMINRIYETFDYCEIKLLNDFRNYKHHIIIKNALVDVDRMIESLNRYYNTVDYETFFEFKRNDDVVFKYFYRWIDYDDDNVSLVVGGSWCKEYERISIDDVYDAYIKSKIGEIW